MIRSVAVRRAKELQEDCPEGEVTQEFLEDRAIVSVLVNNRILETDFIESGKSILLPRRNTEYYDVLGQGIKLGILVPGKKVEEERARLKRIKGKDRFFVIGYDEDLGSGVQVG
ncbi:MAG: hypothetical protein ISF22_05755 [Methanomassiliicoccus sp.]|nr:hypothetical protein [Methanomassiliicoccus sp.]